MNKINKKRVRKRNWAEVDDYKFIQVWANKYAELRGPRKNIHVYPEMAADLSALGIEVTVEEVRNKILNLTKKYRNQKQYFDPLCPFIWPLYNAVHDIIGEEPANKKEVLDSEILIEKESDPLTLSTTQPLTPIKSEPPSSPSLLESPTATPPPSPEPELDSEPKVFHCPSPAVAATSASSEHPAEQAMDALLTVCNRLSENVERHLSQSLMVEKQKLLELRAMRLATTKLSHGILEFLRSSSSNLK